MEILIGASLLLILFVLFAAVLWWRFGTSFSCQSSQLTTVPSHVSPNLQASSSAIPTVDDGPGSLGSSKAKKIVSKHALKIERKGDRTLYRFDGVPYDNWEDIPDTAVREQARQLLPQLDRAQSDLVQGSTKTHILMNGVAYNSPVDIADPRVRQAVEEALKKG